MKEPSFEQPEQYPLLSEKNISEDDLKFILTSLKKMPAEEFVRRFIKAEETEQKDPYALTHNKEIYRKEKEICIGELQNLGQKGVADMLIKRLNG